MRRAVWGLALLLPALGPAGLAGADAWDPADNARGGATLISPTTALQTHGPHTLDGFTDQYDYFAIPMVTGRRYHFDTVGGTGFDYAYLYPDMFAFAPVATDTAGSGGGGQFQFDYDAVLSQTHYLVVIAGSSWSGSLHYSYSLLPAKLVPALVVTPASPGVGQWFTIRFTVTSTGGFAVSNILPSIGVLETGSARVEQIAGPAPAGPVSLSPGVSQTFVWTFSVSAAGKVFFTASASGVDAGSGAPVVATAIGREPGARILVYGPTAGGQACFVPGTVATIWSSTTWAAATTADFAQFDAIAFGDEPKCGVSQTTWGAALANRAVWSAAVTGNVFVTGTDEDTHIKPALVNNGVGFVTSSPLMGLYVSLSCAYGGETTPIIVDLLDQFGDFYAKSSSCNDNVHIVASHPALAGLTDKYLSNWSCSSHEMFSAWPAEFMPLAIARNASGNYTSGDGIIGFPYIVARGVTPAWGYPELHKKVEPVGGVDAGMALTYTVSWLNVGVGTITNLTLTDTLPNGTSYTAPSLNFWAQPDAAGSPVLASLASAPAAGGPWAAGEPADGTGVPLVLRWVVDRVYPGMSGQLRYAVRVSSTLVDGSLVLNRVSATHTFDSARYVSEIVSTTVTQGSIKLSKTVSGEAFAQGEFFTYTLTFSNMAAFTLSNLRLWDTVPPGAGFIGATDGGASDGVKVDWALPDLPPGTTASVSFTVTMNGQAVVVGPNRFWLSGEQSPGTPIPNVVSNGVVVRLKVPQLLLAKSASPVAAPEGASVTYSVLVSSIGEDTADNISIWDTLPPGATYVACTVPPGGSCAAAGSLVAWTLPPLAMGESATITVTALLASPGPAVGPNLAEAGYTSSYPAPRPHVFSNPVTVLVTAPAVAITKSAFPSAVAVGGPFTYTLNISNAGGDTAANVRVWDTLPPGATFVSATDGGAFDGTKVDWTLPDVPSGSGASVSITAIFSSAGPPVGPNTAWLEVTNSTGIPLPAVESNPVTVTQKQAVLAVEKSADRELAPVGTLVTWSVTVFSIGTDVARYITVWDSLPVGLNYAGCTGGGIFDGTKVVWAVADLLPGETVVLTVSGTATPALTCPNLASVEYANSATVWQPAAVSAPVCVTPVQATMTLTKTSPRAIYSAGEPIVYTLAYANSGTDTAVNVTIWDSWTANAVLQSLTGPGALMGGGDWALWILPSVAPGETGFVTVTLTWTQAGCPAGETVQDVAALDYSNSGDIPRTRETAPLSGPLSVDIINASLALTVTPSAWQVRQGDLLTYTVTYANPCTDTAWNVTLWDTLPTGALFYGASAGGSLSGWTLPPVPPGGGGVLTLTVSVTGLGNLGPFFVTGGFANSATVWRQSTSNAVTVGIIMPVLTAVKLPPPVDQRVTQEPVTYIITVQNDGLDSAFGVVVTDTLPARLKLLHASATALETSVTGRTLLTWTIPVLRPVAWGGQPVTFTVQARGPDEEVNLPAENVAFATWRNVNGVPNTAIGDTGPVTLIPRLTIRVYPNPYEPEVAVRGTLKFTGLPHGAIVHIYTLVGSELWTGREQGYRVEWDGRNKQATPVASGFYLYAIEIPGQAWVKGKLGVVR